MGHQIFGLFVFGAAAVSSVWAQWQCPTSKSIAFPFIGSFTAGASYITVLSSSIFVTANSDTVTAVRCVIGAIVDPKRPSQMLLTYGNYGNSFNKTETGCAILDLAVQSSTGWVESTEISSCPLHESTISAYGGWSNYRIQPLCPTDSVSIPYSLIGVGFVTGSGDSAETQLVVNETSWSTVTVGAFVSILCTAHSSDVGENITALSFSNRMDGHVESCVWARPDTTNGILEFKEGLGSACPQNFDDAISIPFTFDVKI